MWHECSSELTAKGVYESTGHKLISDVLGFPVQTNEVIEIDDGLRPYYFFICEYGVEFLAYFDRDSAQKQSGPVQPGGTGYKLLQLINLYDPQI